MGKNPKSRRRYWNRLLPVRVNEPHRVVKGVRVRTPCRKIACQGVNARKPPHCRVVHPEAVEVPAQAQHLAPLFAVVLVRVHYPDAVRPHAAELQAE